MNYDEMIRVIEAAKEGRPIEARPIKAKHKTEDHWLLVVNQSSGFNFNSFNYRVKSKTIWVNEYKDGSIEGFLRVIRQNTV